MYSEFIITFKLDDAFSGAVAVGFWNSCRHIDLAIIKCCNIVLSIAKCWSNS
jgi:hypothetical protein